MFHCNKCGRGVGGQDGGGFWLERVNPVGEVPAVWECRPACGETVTEEEALLGAVSGEPVRGTVRGGGCARKACDNGRPAEWFNNSTRKWYCQPCALSINHAAGETVCVVMPDGPPLEG